jgi:hypothetical protein
MEQLQGTGNSQIELDFDNKYDNEPPHCDHEHIHVRVDDMDDCEVEEYTVWFTIQCISCEKFGRLTLTKGEDNWIESREWD